MNRIGRWFKPWWYTHVQTFLGEEPVPYRDGAYVVSTTKPLKAFLMPHFVLGVTSCFENLLGRIILQRLCLGYDWVLVWLVQEYLPLRDWYHRHTKSIFWCATTTITTSQKAFMAILSCLAKSRIDEAKRTGWCFQGAAGYNPVRQQPCFPLALRLGRTHPLPPPLPNCPSS